jgi:hypothetical protein
LLGNFALAFCFKISVALIRKFSEDLFDVLFAGQPAIVIIGSVSDLSTYELAPIAIPSGIVIAPRILHRNQ